ncbi:MAG: hypothetical protein FJW85_00190 [Actinobacteria bacterium]|nr:hypothetical protein [Actinomycetota bacterium]
MRTLTVLTLAGTALLLAACSAGPTASAGDSASSSAPTTPAATAPESPAPASPAPQTPAAPKKPSAADMETDRLADAVLEQLKIDWPDTLSDQLITIALSPLMRQLASTADVTTSVASKGPKVMLTMTGEDSVCVITVTDEPRARGVVCKAA